MSDERRLSTDDLAGADERRAEVAEQGAGARSAGAARQERGYERDARQRDASERADRGVGGGTAADEAGRADAERPQPLLVSDETDAFQGRWETIQATFVDDPQRAVEQADALVADLMQRLAETFADERRGLEDQWSAGGEASTEDLRVALQRYRSFFHRLLSM